MDCVLYDSRSAQYKTPFGAVKTDESVVFCVSLPLVYQLHAPKLLLYKADEWDTPAVFDMHFLESDGICARFSCRFSSAEPALLFYLFEVQDAGGKRVRIVKNQDGFGVLADEGDAMWQLTVYDKAFETPAFLQQGILYQIFPDRFCRSGAPKTDVPDDRRMHENWYEQPEHRPDADGIFRSNDYFGGDLAGISEKLPYLKSLGVGTIYLNPVFEAHSNHRYNTATYERIDPLLGSRKDLRELCANAKALGIAVVLDGVFNHVGSDSVYFNREKRYGDGGAYHNPASEYRDWFDFVHYPHEYRSWWGFETLPNVNEENEQYANYICGEDGILAAWMRAGVAGWRLDVADELPDSFLDRLHDRVKAENPQAAIIGEVWEDASCKVAYGQRRRYLLGRQLDSVMNYPFKDAILQYVRWGNAPALYKTVMEILENYPPPVIDVLMNSLSTHDVERAITALAGEPAGSHDREWQARHNALSPEQYSHGKKLLQCAAVIQYLLPGVPCLYYGDEAGVCGYRDPFNRSCYPWGQEDAELLAFFQKLGAVRTAYPCLAAARFRAVQFEQSVVAFLRESDENGQFFAAVNRTEHPARVVVPAQFADAAPLFGALHGSELPPFGSVILHLDSD